MFKLLSHTADIRILARAESIEELFESALEGLCNVICENFESIKNSAQKLPSFAIPIETSSFDLSSLLIDFLSDCLSYMHLNNSILFKLSEIDLKSNSIKAIVSGLKVESFDNDVKAVTYHDANITKDKNEMYEVTITLDI